MVIVLIEKILSMALVMLLGVILTKCKLLSQQDSYCLSKLSLYVVIPCVIINSFQVAYTPEVRDGLLLALLGAIIVNALFLLLNEPFKRIFKLDVVEQASILYTNSGNLVIPIVIAILGEEWVIYSMAYISVQMLLLWSHGRMLLNKEKFAPKKLLKNVNMIAVILGIILFFSRIRFPAVMQDAIGSICGMMSPVLMLVTGILLGNLDLKSILLSRRVWLVTVIRLLVFPLLAILVLKASGIAGMVNHGENILLVALLAATTPPAASVMQMAELYGLDAKHACAINVMTTLLCIVTMPVMVALYQL